MQRHISRRVTSNWHRITRKWWVSDETELKTAIWRAEYTEWRWNAQAFESVQAEWGDLGAPVMFMPRVNIQDLSINAKGIENAIFALCDYRDTVEAYFRALDAQHDRMIEVINASPIEIINFGDNLPLPDQERVGASAPTGRMPRTITPARPSDCPAICRQSGSR